MGELGKIMLYIALLVALFIAVAYFAGLATDIRQVTAGANTLIGTLQGRGPNGTLLAYPTNSPNISTFG